MLIDFGNVTKEGKDAQNYPVAFLNLGPTEKYRFILALSSFGCNAPGTYLSEQQNPRCRRQGQNGGSTVFQAFHIGGGSKGWGVDRTSLKLNWSLVMWPSFPHLSDSVCLKNEKQTPVDIHICLLISYNRHLDWIVTSLPDSASCLNR